MLAKKCAHHGDDARFVHVGGGVGHDDGVSGSKLAEELSAFVALHRSPARREPPRAAHHHNRYRGGGGSGVVVPVAPLWRAVFVVAASTTAAVVTVVTVALVLLGFLLMFLATLHLNPTNNQRPT